MSYSCSCVADRPPYSVHSPRYPVHLAQVSLRCRFSLCPARSAQLTSLLSYSAWALVEDKFSPFAKETLAKLVKFVEVRCPTSPSLLLSLTRLLPTATGGLHPRRERLPRSGVYRPQAPLEVLPRRHRDAQDQGSFPGIVEPLLVQGALP